MDAKTIVQIGYDAVSYAYRGDTIDWNDPAIAQYAQWIGELTPQLARGAAVLDMGCGNGFPATKLLLDAGYTVTGVDLSPVQIARAQQALPAAQFLCADMTALAFPADAFAAIVSFYAIIHVPLEEQPALFANIACWLQPGGWFLATVGTNTWTGTEDDWLGVAGGRMYWSHADTATYRQWCVDHGLVVGSVRFVPEGNGGHTLICAQKPLAS